MSHPGIEPGPNAWKASILTIRPSWRELAEKGFDPLTSGL